jgi:hypothetical protein
MKVQLFISLLLVIGISGFTQNLTLHFDYNAFSISDSAEKVLSGRLPDLLQCDSILITGHADTIGTLAYNMELSEKRAEIIWHWLAVKKVQIHIRTVGKGENDILYPYSGYANRRSEIFAYSKKILFPKKEVQAFKIDNHRDTVIRGKEGAILRIPAHSINPSKAHENKQFTVLLTEYYTLSDMVLNGLMTRTASDVLETNGMIYLDVFQEGETCTLEAGTPIQVEFPLHGKANKAMGLFYGKQNQDHDIIWEEQDVISGEGECTIAMLSEKMPSFNDCNSRNTKMRW